MNTCPPSHYRRKTSPGKYLYFPRRQPHRGFVIYASGSGRWWTVTDGFGCLYACPVLDGEDHQWNPLFMTIKEAKMGIDRLISWQVAYRLAFDERHGRRAA